MSPEFMQEAYNQAHGITPATISKKINTFDYTMAGMNANTMEAAINEELKAYDADELNLEDVIRNLDTKMNESAESLEFEQVAQYRDKIRELKKIKTAQP
ncbi:UvrB/UvrC motif-containing protein [Desulfobacter hydrogenophilus]|uniref:UvrB/UvrC motif-containing protein n=1 Tax=Desulfobacter hydrogenophilus TaxID=2291 RepID=UPI001F5FA5A9|nr:UvrB/UvrC motif-containing protein [Desulfobacter hydrogenophilus]